MIIIKNKKSVKERILDIYFGIGAVAMALLAVNVIFTVIMRYCFSLSWKQLSEFNVTLFAFTTFWMMGYCVLKEEHVIIDIFYDGVKPEIKRWLSVLNYVIVFIVMSIFTYYSWGYTMMAGKQISQGMEIPMYFMYGIMPLCGVICLICTVVKIVELIKAPIEYFYPKNKEIRDDRKGA